MGVLLSRHPTLHIVIANGLYRNLGESGAARPDRNIRGDTSRDIETMRPQVFDTRTRSIK